MALSGVHVECGYTGARSGIEGKTEIHARCVWSQTMASPGTTTQTAPANSRGEGDPVFRLTASADVYFAVGPSPDATNGPRRILVASQGPLEIKAEPGDKLAWILVP